MTVIDLCELLPEYDGNENNLFNWITQVDEIWNNVAEDENPDEDRELILLCIKLKLVKRAAAILIVDFIDWPAIRTALKNQVGRLLSPTTIKCKIRSLTQFSTENIDSYAKRARDLFQLQLLAYGDNANIPAFQKCLNEELKTSFENGLYDHNLRESCTTVCNENLEETIIYCKEKEMEKLQLVPSVESSMFCRFCQRIDHDDNGCPIKYKFYSHRSEIGHQNYRNEINKIHCAGDFEYCNSVEWRNDKSNLRKRLLPKNNIIPNGKPTRYNSDSPGNDDPNFNYLNKINKIKYDDYDNKYDNNLKGIYQPQNNQSVLFSPQHNINELKIAKNYLSSQDDYNSVISQPSHFHSTMGKRSSRFDARTEKLENTKPVTSDVSFHCFPLNENQIPLVVKYEVINDELVLGVRLSNSKEILNLKLDTNVRVSFVKYEKLYLNSMLNPANDFQLNELVGNYNVRVVSTLGILETNVIIGGGTFSHSFCVVRSANIKTDGILGFDFMQKYCSILDIVNMQITLKVNVHARKTETVSLDVPLGEDAKHDNQARMTKTGNLTFNKETVNYCSKHSSIEGRNPKKNEDNLKIDKLITDEINEKVESRIYIDSGNDIPEITLDKVTKAENTIFEKENVSCYSRESSIEGIKSKTNEEHSSVDIFIADDFYKKTKPQMDIIENKGEVPDIAFNKLQIRNELSIIETEKNTISYEAKEKARKKKLNFVDKTVKSNCELNEIDTLNLNKNNELIKNGILECPMIKMKKSRRNKRLDDSNDFYNELPVEKLEKFFNIDELKLFIQMNLKGMKIKPHYENYLKNYVNVKNGTSKKSKWVYLETDVIRKSTNSINRIKYLNNISKRNIFKRQMMIDKACMGDTVLPNTENFSKVTNMFHENCLKKLFDKYCEKADYYCHRLRKAIKHENKITDEKTTHVSVITFHSIQNKKPDLFDDLYINININSDFILIYHCYYSKLIVVFNFLLMDFKSRFRAFDESSVPRTIDYDRIKWNILLHT